MLARTDSLASSSSFWESLLRPHYLRLKREEEVRFLSGYMVSTTEALDTSVALALGSAGVANRNEHGKM